mmetsp:Transcript_18032/g.28288  ORF Transcript_18032/g.28288 Transcript_18032/m.28288 type:complete len:332 (-) Transcript_18032:50-1045(-)
MHMSSIATEIISLCAACGKEEGEDNKLKSCTACNMVKYCNRDCQIAHRPRHKHDCRTRAAEIRDETLFAQPPPNEDCPVCCYMLPPMQQTYQSCCGKMLCDGCIDAHHDTHCENFLDSNADITDEEVYPKCPFCRTLAPTSSQEEIKRLQKRSNMKDANAMCCLAIRYEKGSGVSRDVNKAIELWTKAAELGSIQASALLADAYNPYVRKKVDGVAKDMKKVFHYYEIAAKGGHCMARANLGVLEAGAGNMDSSRKHYMISAAQGNDNALMAIKAGYLDGHITKDDFAKALRAHKVAQDEMKSEHRTKAANKDKDACRCPNCRLNNFMVEG